MKKKSRVVGTYRIASPAKKGRYIPEGAYRHSREDLFNAYGIRVRTFPHSLKLLYENTGNTYTWWTSKGSLIREVDGRYLKYGVFFDVEDVAKAIHQYDIEYTN